MYDHANIIKFFILASLCIICISISLFVGEVYFSLKDFWLTFLGQGTTLQEFILFHLRLPHTLNAFVIGCLLALAGYLMQVTLSNPLADPYTLGTSGGAAVFTLLGMLWGLDGLWMMGFSFAGCILSVVLLMLAIGNLKHTSSSRLLLMGVVLASGWGALLSLLLILSPATTTRPLLYWLFGEIDNQSYPISSFLFLAIGAISSWRLRRELNVISQGTLLAKTLGVDIEKLQIKLIILSSLLTTAAVTLGGMIGFVGLVVPHLTRMLIRTQHYLLLPCTILVGGSLVLLADIFSRIIMPPEQLPIGLLTIFIGIPFFIYLSRKRHE